MKRILLLLFIYCILFVGCGNECINAFQDISLSSVEYNKCDEVLMKYTFFVNKASDYPYWENEGDTIRIKGWIIHSYGNPIKAIDETDLSFYMSDDSILALNPSQHKGGLEFEGPICLIDSIELKKKCYVTGTLSFKPKFTFYKGIINGEGCEAPRFVIRVLEIEN